MKHLSTCALALASLSFGVSAVVTAQRPKDEGSPIYGVKLPQGYRDWRLISVAHEAGKNNDIRAILGNDIAVKAFRDGKRPFPDGAVIVRLAWRYESSPRNDSVFPAPQSFVAGPPTNVQVSVKDSKRYAASGGWGYGQFENGVANRDVALTQSCFACHSKLNALEKGADLIFTAYSR
ncbi:cytochrome P460 family protein [Sphingomonas cannabina]|uniref:cytochrome P460 family protein n=1 Tax=Sphingomonas cannabina TaxID=2899123 RepID=UPI001F2B5FFB|nr:cytochrome P460 family protein [Sphingomonas cannabina]UIJ46545.1 cytochrome P460 family protein [Sphingomonas cannabina]